MEAALQMEAATALFKRSRALNVNLLYVDPTVKRARQSSQGKYKWSYWPHCNILHWQLRLLGLLYATYRTSVTRCLGLSHALLLQMRKRREFLKIRREEAKADDGVQVAIPAPDPPLPPTFDADVTAHRYRFLEQPGGWLAR